MMAEEQGEGGRGEEDATDTIRGSEGRIEWMLAEERVLRGTV